MPIGSSSGEYFNDTEDMLAAQANKQQAITIKPVKEESSTTSTIPGGSPTELAGALKSSGGTETPDKLPETNFRDASQDIKVNPWVTITPEDIERGINIGLSAGPGTMAGVKAKTVDFAALKHAETLESQGAPVDVIHQNTGFSRGDEG